MIDVLVGIRDVAELVVEKEVTEDDGSNGVPIFCVACAGIAAEAVEGLGKTTLDEGCPCEAWYACAGVIAPAGKA